MTPLHRIFLLCGLLAAFVAAGTATAQDPAPTPGCAGLSLSDPKDDAKRLEGATDAPDNFDITGLFFKYSGGKTYAVMQFQGPGGSDLPPGATGARWYIFFSKGGQEMFVRAGNITPDGESFEYGHTDTESPTGQYALDGETTGRFGDGFLEMVVPTAIAKTGEAMTAPRAETFERVGNQLFGIDASNSNGKTYTVAKCEEPGAGQPAPDPTPVPSATPAPGGGNGGGEVKALQVAAPKSAKAKGRSLTLKVSSNGEVKSIKAVLKQGKKAVGKGSLARLNGKGTLKLKLSKKLKKGAYKLELSGINPDGKAASRAVSLKLK